MSKIALRLITTDDLNYQSIKRLKEWRKKNKFAYLGDYKITHKSVEHWLWNSLLYEDSRFLFWIIVSGEYVGHVGVKNIKRNSIEIDNFARGEAKHKGVMHEALKMITDAYFDKKIWLQVVETNKHAIEFYLRNKFKITGQKGKLIQMEFYG